LNELLSHQRVVPEKPIVNQLRDRGVIVHAPLSCTFQDIDAERIEAGVEIYGGVNLVGKQTRFGAGTKIGKAGGGYFENVQAGRGCDLFGGYYKDCVFLDGVTIRGHAEMRGGTVLEEGCEAAQHVGYKMTVMLPYVVAGSLLNFCDALFAGGTSRKDHSEIGSCLALYNFTPWGDKWASQFGDVARGVFMRSPKIFVGGQTQIVSPVHVGFGSVIPAGCAVRRDVPEGRMVGAASVAIDMPFDAKRYGTLTPKLKRTVVYLANMRALLYWYQNVRMPIAGSDLFLVGLYQGAMRQILANISERIKRLDQLVERLPSSIERLAEECEIAKALGDEVKQVRYTARMKEQQSLVERWPSLRSQLMKTPPPISGGALKDLVAAYGKIRAKKEIRYIDFIRHAPGPLVTEGIAHMEAYTRQLSLADLV
jgi:hypothetical protein